MRDRDVFLLVMVAAVIAFAACGGFAMVGAQ